MTGIGRSLFRPKLMFGFRDSRGVYLLSLLAFLRATTAVACEGAKECADDLAFLLSAESVLQGSEKAQKTSTGVSVSVGENKKPGFQELPVATSHSSKKDIEQTENTNNWFYVGLADITFGRRTGTESLVLSKTRPDEYPETWSRGRLAMYLKGKIKGDVLITAAFDTRDEDLDQLFSNLEEKDPRQLLRTLDPDDFYPVYGDDSTTVEDAPTSGKFYVRIEKGENHLLWGNFKTTISETEFARFERGLYGAHAKLQSNARTDHDEPMVSFEGFASQPGTVQQRDEFRGTGGSTYFLSRQDISSGSEQVFIERRNAVTRELIVRKSLKAGQDYEFDHVQGVVILKEPLQSTTRSSSSVRSRILGDEYQLLVVTYECSPALSDVSGYVYGGRTQLWVNDNLRIGATGYSDSSGHVDRELTGLDLLLRRTEKSFVELEVANSDGDDFGESMSFDGGFIFNRASGGSTGGKSSRALRGKASLDIAEVSQGRFSGGVAGYYERLEAGFISPGRNASVGEQIVGVSSDLELSRNTRLRITFDEVRRDDGRDNSELLAEVEHKLGDELTGAMGVIHSERQTGAEVSSGTGARTDLGFKLTRKREEENSDWIFGQATVQRSGTRQRNDRVGLGAERRISESFSGSAEVSFGTTGIGALAQLRYSPNETESYHLGYRLSPSSAAADVDSYDPFVRDYGAIVFGAKRQINERLIVNFEENYDFMGTERSLTHTFGTTYRPDDLLSLYAGIEAGEVYDAAYGDFERIGFSIGAQLRDEDREASLRFEARLENGFNSSNRDRHSYLLSGKYGYNQNDDWRMVANVDAVVSRSNQATILDGDYIEGSLGWAYRKRDDDRINALLRYSYLEDLPGSMQVNNQNELSGPRQRSHVFEADVTYDLFEKLSVGGKYGFRTSQIEAERGSGEFSNSTAHLLIGRVDFHVVKNWDVLLEARSLWVEEFQQAQTGYLAAVYRHVGDNLKVGVGYNFSSFSDNITDLTHDDEGVFLNIVGKF